ncbi:MAG: hypothetical protein D6734_12450 [Candidatus Schekmanbacteria bacterium]|nr:MAG: hypothetical protein D6734_12450 [Candidatus Schekmanbacteria bacterium]
MAGISVGGLASGIDFNNIIDQLVEIEQQPLQLYEERKNTYQEKIDSLNNINSSLASLLTKCQTLNTSSQFNLKSVSVSDTDVLTASASSSAVTGNYSVEVLQTASSHKIASQGVNDINATSISSSSGNFSFRVGSGDVTDIAVTSTTTLLQLKDAINNSNAGVTASIVNDGSATNPYRLVLTADSTGQDNEITITTNVTDLDFSNKSIESVYSDTNNSFDGTATASGTYTGTGSKTYIVEITTGGSIGTAKFKVSDDGGATWTADDAFTTSTSPTSIYNSSDEGVDIAFTAGTTNFAVGDRFEIDVFDPTLESAQDAIVKVNNINFRKSSNTISDIIPGVTLELKSTTSGTPVTLSVTKDTSTVKENINDFVEAYNSVIELINEQTAYDAENDEAGPLLGNSAVRNAELYLKRIISNNIPGLSDTYTTLSQIGISTQEDGTLSVDDDKLSDALDDYYDNVEKLFVKYGSTTNSEIEFSTISDETEGGTYAVNITQVPLQAVVNGSQPIQSSGLGADETLTFTFSGVDYTVNLSAGDKIDTVVEKINTQLSNQNVPISAANNGGALKLYSQEYGSGISFTVTSDQPDTSASTGIGTSGKSDTGQDVAGTINGHTATAVGNSLTGADGYDEEGLQILVYSTTTGSKGTVTVSLGVAEQMIRKLDFITDSTDGTIQASIDSYQEAIDEIDETIDKKNESIDKMEERLLKQFTALESIISSLNAQNQALSSFLAKI